MKVTKSTNVELVTVLKARNVDGAYDSLIREAEAGWYHDYKNPPHIVCGKMYLATRLLNFPALSDIREAVIRGDYDESPDEKDKEEMRKDLNPKMWPLFGL